MAVALVTGAASGIGAAIALRLAKDGAAVAVNHLPDQDDSAAQVVAQIESAGGRAAAFRADVSDDAAVAAMVAAVPDRLGGEVSTLVCNAAVAVTPNGVAWHELSAADWASVLGVNVTGAFLCARHCYPAMRAAGSGSVVVVSSVTPLLGHRGNLHYVTSKAALIGFTRTLAREVGADGIRVNAVAPGAIEGPNERDYGTPEEVDAQVFAVQALRKRGQGSDVASVVSYLSGPDAGFITGQLLVVDGGWVMH